MKYLNTILVNRGMAEDVIHSLRENDIKRYTVMLAEGSANSKYLRQMGLGEIKKEIILCMTGDETSSKLEEIVKDEFDLDKTTKGVYFRVPLNMEDGKDMRAVAVYVIVDRGRADDIIEKAREVGQTGASVIHARGSGIEKQVAFFKTVIEPEKDIVLFVVPIEDKDKILATLKDALYIDEEEHGVIFTVPVVETIGFKFDENRE